MSLERQLEKNARADGRGYSVTSETVDSLVTSTFVWDAEEIILERLKDQKDCDNKLANIEGLTDYFIDRGKTSVDRDPEPLNRVYATLAQARRQRFRPLVGVTDFGIFLVIKQGAFPFDLVDQKSKTPIIHRGSSVAELIIPPVDFTYTSGVITPLALRQSLGLIASSLDRPKDKTQAVIGLTHNRLGRIARRWGFTLVEDPFPQEVQETLDTAISAQPEPKYQKVLQTFRRQVLVYQPKADFMTMARAARYRSSMYGF